MATLTELLANERSERQKQERGLAGTSKEVVTMQVIQGNININLVELKVERTTIPDFQLDNPNSGLDGTDPTNTMERLDTPAIYGYTNYGESYYTETLSFNYELLSHITTIYPIMLNAKIKIAKWLVGEVSSLNWIYMAVGDGTQEITDSLSGLANELGRFQPTIVKNGQYIYYYLELPPTTNGWTISEVGIFDDSTEGQLLAYATFDPVALDYDHYVKITMVLKAEYGVPIMDKLWDVIGGSMIGSSYNPPGYIGFSNTEITVDNTAITSMPGEVARKEVLVSREDTTAVFTATLLTTEAAGETIRTVGLFETDTSTEPLMLFSGFEFQKTSYDSFQQIFRIHVG